MSEFQLRVMGFAATLAIAQFGAANAQDGQERFTASADEERSGAEVTVFLMACFVVAARKGQNTPNGYYNIERMLKRVVGRGSVLLCGTCMDARSMIDDNVMDDARRSTLDELAAANVTADQVLVF